MRENKFIKLLRTLSKKELKNFSSYLHNLYKDRIRELFVFDYIMEYKNDWQSNALDKEVALNTCFKKENINSSTLSTNILFKLHKYLEEFLIREKLNEEESSFLKNKLLLEIYEERKLDGVYEKKLVSMRLGLEIQDQNMWDYLKLFELNYINYFSSSNDKKTIKGKDMEELMKYLDGFFISVKLKLGIEQKFRERILGKKIDINFLSSARILAETPCFRGNKLLSIYYLFLNLLEEKEGIKYAEFRELVEEQYKNEIQRDQSILFGFLLNFLAGSLKTGDNKYAEEMLSWIDYGFKSKLIYEYGYIQPSIFHNLVNVVCRLKKIEFAEQLIQQYVTSIKKEYRKDTESIGNAFIDLAKKDYDKIITNIKPNRISHRIMNLRARLILLMVHTEKRDSLEIIDCIAALKRSIRETSDLSAINKLSARNMAKYTEKLMNLKVSVDTFKSDIKEETFIFHKMWLLEQIDQDRKFI